MAQGKKTSSETNTIQGIDFDRIDRKECLNKFKNDNNVDLYFVLQVFDEIGGNFKTLITDSQQQYGLFSYAFISAQNYARYTEWRMKQCEMANSVLERRINDKKIKISEIREIIETLSDDKGDENKRAISMRLRFYILNRDRFTCTYCGRKAPDIILHIDHKTPYSLGGKTNKENLTTACADCNLGKSNLYTH